MPVGTESMKDNRERLQELVYVTETLLDIVRSGRSNERKVPRKQVEVSDELCQAAERSIDSVKICYSLD